MSWRPTSGVLAALQNLANELPALDAKLTERVARGFADSTAIIAEHFRGAASLSHARRPLLPHW
jgi:hypothetical protein